MIFIVMKLHSDQVRHLLVHLLDLLVQLLSKSHLLQYLLYNIWSFFYIIEYA